MQDAEVLYSRHVAEPARRRMPLLPLVLTVLLFLAAPIPLAMDLMEQPSQGVGLRGTAGTGVLGLLALLGLGGTVLAMLSVRQPLRLIRSADGRAALQVGVGPRATTLPLPAPAAAYYYVARSTTASSPVLVLVLTDATGRPLLALEEHLQPRDHPPHGWPLGNGPTPAPQSFGATLLGSLDLPGLKHLLDQIAASTG